MNSLDPFKRGDTFSLACIWKSSGAPASITGLTIKAQIRTADTLSLVDNLLITPADQSLSVGKFTLTPGGSTTSDWPLGDLICDLQVSQSGIIRSSDSFLIPIIENVTK